MRALTFCRCIRKNSLTNISMRCLSPFPTLRLVKKSNNICPYLKLTVKLRPHSRQKKVLVRSQWTSSYLVRTLSRETKRPPPHSWSTQKPTTLVSQARTLTSPPPTSVKLKWGRSSTPVSSRTIALLRLSHLLSSINKQFTIIPRPLSTTLGNSQLALMGRLLTSTRLLALIWVIRLLLTNK